MRRTDNEFTERRSKGQFLQKSYTLNEWNSYYFHEIDRFQQKQDQPLLWTLRMSCTAGLNTEK